MVIGPRAARGGVFRQLAVELAPHGVVVNAIKAGVTPTPALDKIPSAGALLHFAQEHNPSGRVGGSLRLLGAGIAGGFGGGGRRLPGGGGGSRSGIGRGLRGGSGGRARTTVKGITEVKVGEWYGCPRRRRTAPLVSPGGALILDSTGHRVCPRGPRLRPQRTLGIGTSEPPGDHETAATHGGKGAR